MTSKSEAFRVAIQKTGKPPAPDTHAISNFLKQEIKDTATRESQFVAKLASMGIRSGDLFTDQLKGVPDPYKQRIGNLLRDLERGQ